MKSTEHLELGEYYKSYFFEGQCINPSHRLIHECELENGLILYPSPEKRIAGWLRKDDALKLYELAYYSKGDIIEFGSYRGLSTSIIALAIKNSNDAKRLFSVEIDLDNHNATKKIINDLGLGQKVSLCHTDSMSFIAEIESGDTFGFIFVDHCHKYNSVKEVCSTLHELIFYNGYCMFHDYLDSRNSDPGNDDFAVPQAVSDHLDEEAFCLEGYSGCSAIFRRKGDAR